MNAQQQNLGPRSEINAYTGYFPFVIPHPWPSTPPIIGRRLQVHHEDLDPVLNDGALYFGEAQYVTPDDALARNNFNNVSYRAVQMTKLGENNYGMASTPTGGTIREPAIRVWKDSDPAVVETEIFIPHEGMLILAAKATPLGPGSWRYEYALYNMNSDRSVGAFSLPIPFDAAIANIGFHDVDYHSNEIYDGTDWPGVAEDGLIRWATESYEDNPNANAIRWGTLYNFRFDSNAEPNPQALATIGIFKTGFPTSVTATTVGPLLAFVDCNRNRVADSCDLSCGPSGGDCQVEGCGTSNDCNENLIPDDCEYDCNENGIADSCDLQIGTSTDCNRNEVPDDCEPDCDGDGITDVCDGSDADLDGVIDCDDLCPETTPEAACFCPPTGDCCFPSVGICIPDFPPQDCVNAGGRPECFGSLCNEGCLWSDGDSDGKLTLADLGLFMDCYTGPGGGGFEPPLEECSFSFDVDGDGDIDLSDFEELRSALNGP